MIVVCADGAQAVAVSAAIARAFPLYCRKTGEGAEGARVVYADVVSQVQNNAINHAHLQRIGVRSCTVDGRSLMIRRMRCENAQNLWICPPMN